MHICGTHNQGAWALWVPSVRCLAGSGRTSENFASGCCSSIMGGGIKGQRFDHFSFSVFIRNDRRKIRVNIGLRKSRSKKNRGEPALISTALPLIHYFSRLRKPSSSIVFTMLESTIDAGSAFKTSGRVRPISARIVFIPSSVGYGKSGSAPFR
jgi:hypothetical protein